MRPGEFFNSEHSKPEVERLQKSVVHTAHTRGDKHGIKHGVTHGSEPLDQDGERAATQDSTDDLLDGDGDGSATVFGMATPVSPTVAI